MYRVQWETDVLELSVACGNYSAASTMFHMPYTNICSAGSLAVIFQPAFVPFVDAADYLQLCCLSMPVSVACAAGIVACWFCCWCWEWGRLLEAWVCCVCFWMSFVAESLWVFVFVVLWVDGWHESVAIWQPFAPAATWCQCLQRLLDSVPVVSTKYWFQGCLPFAGKAKRIERLTVDLLFSSCKYLCAPNESCK